MEMTDVGTIPFLKSAGITTASRLHDARTNRDNINFYAGWQTRHALLTVRPIVLVRRGDLSGSADVCESVSAWMCTKKAFGWERVVERARSRAEKQNS